MATKSVLSNVDLIRRFVFERQPVTAQEIAAEVQQQMVSVSSEETALERYVLPVLHNQPYYRETNGAWQIIREQMPEYQVLVKVMDDEHRLLYEREVRSKVAAKLGVKVFTVVLELEQAPELKKFGTRWGLKEWVLANDQAAEVLAQNPGGLNEKDLLKHITERFKFDPKLTILDLKSDKQKRFVADRKLWYLKEDYKKLKQAAREQAVKLPRLKTGEIDLKLEDSFLEAQTVLKGEESDTEAHVTKARLKKALKRQAQDIIEHREDLAPKPEDLAAKLSQVLSAAGVDEYGVKSFQRVEPAPKERGLSAKEREDIQQFIDQLLELETVGVGAPLQSVVNAPLSARKMQDVLRLKYISFTRDRAVIPNEYLRFLVEMLKPRLDRTLLHPACFDGSLAVELLSSLYDRLEGAAWAFVEEESALEIVQPDGERYRIGGEDASLIEAAKDKFLVTQVDLINHFLNYKYTGIELDKVIARAARVITRLSGYESAYIVSRDFLTELPEVFGLPPNEDNEIPIRFDGIIGNYTFAQDANLAANYLDQSLRLLAPGGRLAVFILHELMRLLKEHALLGDFFAGTPVTHYIRLPVIEGRHKVILLISEARDKDAVSPIITAEIRDFKSANELLGALQADDESQGAFKRIEQQALAAVIG